VSVQEYASGAGKLQLFASIHGVNRVHAAAVSTKPDLDEHGGVSVPHDQVDFSTSAQEIALQGAQALPLEKALGT
jgi:hypothetical protein